MKYLTNNEIINLPNNTKLKFKDRNGVDRVGIFITYTEDSQHYVIFCKDCYYSNEVNHRYLIELNEKFPETKDYQNTCLIQPNNDRWLNELGRDFHLAKEQTANDINKLFMTI